MTEISLNKEILGHFPCPVCGSKDNLVKYKLLDYGVESFHCFTPNCSNHLSDEDALKGHAPKQSVFIPRELECKALVKRNITKSICREYGVMVDPNNAEYVFPYFDGAGVQVARKMRKATDKVFYWEGDTKNSHFFGYNTITRKNRPLVITEGEFDALAAKQLLGSEFNVVSIPNGAASAKEFIKKHLKWVEQFKSVYVCFDNDDAGDDATSDVMGIIRKGQAYRVTLQYKDANEYLLKHTDNHEASRLFKQDFEKAKCADYDGIVPSSQVSQWLYDEMTGKSSVYEGIGETGIPDLDVMFSMRKSELTTVFADPSVGKSSVIRWVVKNLIEQGKQILILALEETPREWLTKVAGMLLGRPIIGCLGDERISEEQALDLANKVAKFARVSTTNGSINVDELKTLIEYSVRSDDTELVVLDNITAACADDSQVATRLSQTLSTMLQLSKEFGHHTLVVSHTKRRDTKDRSLSPSMFDGFGSGSIERFSHNVIALSRDVENNDQKVTIRIVKQRATGKLGQCSIIYNPKTGCFSNEHTNKDRQVRLENRRTVPQEQPKSGANASETEDIHDNPKENDDPRLPDSREVIETVHRSEGLSETGMVRKDDSFRAFRQTHFKGMSRKSPTHCEPFHGTDYWELVDKARLLLDADGGQGS